MGPTATREAPMPEAVAAIDIGTNSVHMVVARVAGKGRFEVITRQKEMVRLGSGKGEMKELAPDAIDRGVEALRRCGSIAESFGAPVYAVATSAVREADNAGVFIARAREEAGVEVEVISGYEEARLIHLGVLQALPVFDRRLLLVDVGGGSTEVLVGHRGVVEVARSVKLGSLRMTRRFFPDGTVEGDAVRRCREDVRSRLAPMAHDVAPFGHEVAVATSGTAEALCRLALTLRGESVPQSLNGATVDLDELTRAVDHLAAVPTVEERRALPGVESSRADILVGGGIVLEQVCRSLGVEELTISDYALREGVLLDAYHRLGGEGFHKLPDLRRSSVFHLMELCDDDPDHSLQVARLAVRLHDALGARLGLTDPDRELLEYAALLSNAGLFISHSGHHKHSYYVIRNSEHLMGFTDREIELIAQVARYHRKSPPSVDKHAEYAALSADDRRRVRSMASLLRVAIGMDRNHDAGVADLDASVPGSGPVELVLRPREPGADLTLECHSASSRATLLADELGAAVEISASAEPAA